MKTKLLFQFFLLTLTGFAMAKKPLLAITQDLAQAHQKVTVGSLYYHHRSPEKLYKVLSLSINTAHEDTILVNYQNADDANDVIWSRPLEDFLSLVKVDGHSISKFTPKHNAIR